MISPYTTFDNSSNTLQRSHKLVARDLYGLIQFSDPVFVNHDVARL